MERTALIVDDEEDIGLMVSVFLKKSGVGSTYLSRVTPALEKIADETFDFYFLDLNLPDGTGFDLIPLIHQNNPAAQIIIISAYDSHLETARAEDFKVKAFVKKPFTKQDILATLE
jgi:DNA-binding NtrC family response regulator